MRVIRSYTFPGNQAQIRVSIQDSPPDSFVLSLTRPSPDFCDMEVAIRPDEALLIASMLTQAVAMACSAYDVDIDTDGSQVYGNFKPEEGKHE
jgi:hypothetical protein